MDFGVVGLGGLVGSGSNSSGFTSLAIASSDPETKQKWYGSGLLKQERSATTEDDWRSSKLSKTEPILLQNRSTLLKSNTTLFTDGQQQQQQMLSFSCPKSALSVERSSQNATLPYFHLTSSAYNRNTGTIISNAMVLSLCGVCSLILGNESDILVPFVGASGYMSHIAWSHGFSRDGVLVFR